MKNALKVFAIALVLLFAATFVFAEGQKEAGEKKEANLVYVNWAEGVAYTHVAKVVLEQEMGYTCEITAADVAPAYTAVAEGDMDAYMESWLPVLHKDYVEKYQDDLVDLGYVFEGTQVGLVIPQYMADDGVTTISDLLKPDVMKKLNKKITGIDAGAGVMKTTENEVMPKYGLTDAGYKLVASSGPAMTAALKDAVENEEYIVVTGWRPHWKFGVWDLTFLKQDKEQVWGKGNIHIFGRKNLEQDKPELYNFLKNMHLSNEAMGRLLVAYKDADDPLEMAKKWVADNPDAWADWIP